MSGEFLGMYTGGCQPMVSSILTYAEWYKQTYEEFRLEAMNLEWSGEDYDAWLELWRQCDAEVELAHEELLELASLLRGECEQQDRTSEPDPPVIPGPPGIPR